MENKNINTIQSTEIIGGTVTSPIYSVDTQHLNLKKIDYIPQDSSKRKSMERKSKLIDEVEPIANEIKEKHNNLLKSFERITTIDSQEKYQLKKKILNELSKVDYELLSINNKISKSYYYLLMNRISLWETNRSINPKSLYSLILTYEKKIFRIDVYKKLQIRKISKMNYLIWKNQLDLDFLNSIKQEKYLNNIFAKGIKLSNIEKNIEKTEKAIKDIKNKKELFIEKYETVGYSKLIKKLDKLSHDKKFELSIIKDNNVIKLQNVSKYFYSKWMVNKVLSDINLTIKKGEFVVIMGPSGSGKTTLLNIISGMDTATYGKTIIADNNLIFKSNNELTKFRKENIGYIFQQYGLLPNLNVEENIELGANLQSDKSKRLDIDEIMKAVGMYDHRKKFPHELSGGQQQRVSIARSMIKNPVIVFGDEPTGAVDEQMSKQIMKLFVDINKKFNTTVVIVTHNPIFADLATRVIKINNGQIILDKVNKTRKEVDELNWVN